MQWIALGLFSALVLAIAIFASRAARRGALIADLKLRLLLIQIPRERVEEKDFRNELNLSSQLFSILAGMKVPFAFEAAVHQKGQEIHFYAAVPERAAAATQRNIEGLFKDARVSHTEDYTIFSPRGEATGAYIKEREHYSIPLRTFGEAGADTFAPILSNLSKIEEEGEGAAIQVIMKPADKSAEKNLHALLLKIRKGEKDKEGNQKPIDENKIKAIETKLSKPLLEINYRIAASAATKEKAEMLLGGITQSLLQFQAPFRNNFEIKKPGNVRRFMFRYAFREFDPAQKMILNTEEAASVFHLPSFSSAAPGVKWLKSREAPPPVNLPKDGTLVGKSVFRGETKPVYISSDDRRRHVYIVGQTGTGKSTLLKTMAHKDIERGDGVAVLDPHGELVDDILSLVSRERKNDVVVFDPGDIEYPLGLNMLEFDPSRPEEKTFIVNELLSIFGKLFSSETMGPMFEQYMRNALLLLMEGSPRSEPATLMEVPRVFTDPDFRMRLLENTTNPTVVDFWEREAVKAGGEASLVNITPYITSKFNNFTANDYLRPIIGQTRTSLNFRKIMDEKKILLVNLSKGKIGDINANLLGMIVTGKILMAALSRADLPEAQRNDFYLYIDEFQNFTTDSIATILSEARKYGLSLTVAHQFIAQLTDKTKHAVFGNAGSLIAFRVGAEDAEFLANQFAPVFTKYDLVNIDNFNAYAKLLVGGETSLPFNIQTIPLEAGGQDGAQEIKQNSRMQYGKPREAVEREILVRLRS